jgi:hemolysin D
MKQPRVSRVQDGLGKAYRGFGESFGKNMDRVRRLIPANDDRHETAFLPAALEVVETPPSPLGRMLLYAICALFVIAWGWAYFGKVDLVATAQGKIIPSGKVKVIQPLEIGVVRRIAVSEGQRVKTGDVLVEIDPTGSKAEAQRFSQELMENRIEAARLGVTAKADGPGPAAEQAFLNAVPAGTDKALVDRNLALLQSSLAQQAATVAGIDSDSAQKQAEHKQVETEIRKLQGTIPLIKKRAEMRKELVAKGYSSVMEESREQQSLIESEQNLTEMRHRLVQSEAAVNQLTEQRREAVAKFQATTLTSLADAEGKADDAQQQLIKAQDLASHRTLTAPVDGTVQQLALHTVGGVVTPAQELMVVVPQGAVLEIEAMIQNKDIGFVREGQQAEIKLETFPFTRYGLRHGTVLEVSPDAVAPAPASQQERNKNGSTPDNGQQTPQSPDSLYTARISLDRDTMPVDGRDIRLAPGMTVTAEIKTGRQRIIDYLLDPLRRYRHESFQER